MARSPIAIFENFRTRYFVVVWFSLPFFLPGVGYVFWFLDLPLAEHSWPVVYALYAQILLTIAIIATALLPRPLPIREIFGREPRKRDVLSGLALTAYLYVLAWPAAYVLFLPLSYWIPDIVQYWYIDVGDIVVFVNGNFHLATNLFNIISLCILAPVIEEFAFRGIILHRWAHKFGIRSAILGSSLVFAIVHPDPLGAFFFGIGMCVLYLRTQSLMLPIICHGLYNLVVWIIELAYKLERGTDYRYTLEAFQSEWPVAVAAIVLIVVWTAFYFRADRRDVAWRLPIT